MSVEEAGRRKPSVPTPAPLIAATDHELSVGRPKTGLRRLTGPVGRRLRRRRADVLSIAARYGVGVLGVFGSVARGEDGTDSDVDLLVELPEGMGMLALGRLRQVLEELLDCPVDLIPESDLKPQVRPQVEAQLVRL